MLTAPAMDDGRHLQLTDPKDNRVLMTTCLTVTLFFREASSPEKRAAILEMLGKYERMMAGKINWTTNPQSGSWKDLRKKPFTSPHDWLMDLDDEPWEFIYHGGEHNRDASDVRFNVLAKASWQERQNRTSWITVNFPISFFADHSERFQDLLIRWIDKLQPLHGYAAIGTTHNHFKSYRHETLEYQWAQQYPGLDISNHIDHGIHINDNIKGINWLTVLHQSYLDRIGGLDALNPIEGLTVWQAGEVYLIQAAPQPALAKIPDSYYQLGQLLAPIRDKTLYNIHHWKGEHNTFTGRGYHSWLARFDKKP